MTRTEEVRGPYDCSIHRVPLRLEVLEVSAFGRKASAGLLEKVYFWRCPIVEKDGQNRSKQCMYMKPAKHQRRLDVSGI